MNLFKEEAFLYVDHCICFQRRTESKTSVCEGQKTLKIALVKDLMRVHTDTMIQLISDYVVFVLYNISK